MELWLAGWLSMLSRLETLEKSYYEARPLWDSHLITSQIAVQGDRIKRLRPVFKPLPNSWDLMPPDVVRPLATTALGDILIIVHRRGMEWREIRPGEGIMHAEGSGHSLTSIEIRSLGLALRNTFSDFQADKTTDNIQPGTPLELSDMGRPHTQLFIPSLDAEKMAFGIIPADLDLMTEDYDLGGGQGSLHRTERVLRELSVDSETCNQLLQGASRDRFLNQSTQRDDVLNGFNDPLYLLPPWLPIVGTGAVRMRLPNRVYHQPEATPLNWREGNVVFWQRLEELLRTMETKPRHLIRVFKDLDMLARNYPKNCIHIHELNSNTYHWNGEYMCNEKTLLELKRMWDDCVSFLVSLQRKYHCTESNYEKHSTGRVRGFRYTDLVAAHIEWPWMHITQQWTHHLSSSDPAPS